MYPISMVFDEAGNLYTSDMNSRLIKYDAARDRLVFLDTRPYAHPWNTDSRCSWITYMGRAPDGRIYGLTYSNDHLFRFDPQDESPRIEDLGPGVPGTPCETLRCLVPDREGNLYYLAQPTAPEGPGSLLVRRCVASGETRVVGRMEVNGEVYGTWRGVCGRDGTLYLATVGRVPACLLIHRP
jgi:hypothetical protein